MVKIINTIPDSSIVKRKVCNNCGATLQYVPNDIRIHLSTDYTSCREFDNVIDCPNCGKMLFV